MNNKENTPKSRTQMPLHLILLVLLSLAVYWDFLTFSKLYLYKDIGSDTLNVFYPGYVHLADYFRSDGWPGWSFRAGMGASVFPGGIANPFNWLLYLIGSEHLAFGLVYVQTFKILLAGVLFYAYLRLLSLAPPTATMGSLFYAFSSFMILGGTWYVFSSTAVHFALLLFAVERYLQNRKWIFLVLAAAFVAANSAFNLYVFTLFFLPYILLRHYALHGWQPRELLPFLLKLAGLAALGLGISAVFLSASLYGMINSPRVSGDVSLFGALAAQSPFAFGTYEHNLTAIMRLFSSDLLGTGSEFRGWKNYLEAPMFYCGLLGLLLAPQYVMQLERKQRIAYAAFGLIFLVPVLLPFYRHVFWAFAGDYYRLYSAFVAFVFLFFGLHALDAVLKTGRVHVTLLIATLGLLVVVLFAPNLLGPGAKAQWVDETLRLVIAGLFLTYAILIIALRSGKYRLMAQRLLLVLVCVELAGFSWLTVNDRPVVTASEFGAKTGYNDYSVDAIAFIKQNDPGFYRVEKTYSSGPAIHSSLNDAKVQGYFGTNSYSSFNQLNYIRFLDVLGVIDGTREFATRWAGGIINYPALVSFTGIKYVLTKQPELVQGYLDEGYELVHEAGDVSIMKNPNYLPFGFTYDTYMTEETFMSLPQLSKNVALMKTAVVNEEFPSSGAHQLEPFDKAEVGQNYEIASYLEDVRQRRAAVLDIKSFRQSHITGQISLDRPKMLFFTLPYDRGWTATVDGMPAELLRVNIGFTGLPLPAGEHVVELRYRPPLLRVGLLISIISTGCFAFLIWRARRRPRHPNDVPA
jgi:uncharacterized membrane protein YfhO